MYGFQQKKMNVKLGAVFQAAVNGDAEEIKAIIRRTVDEKEPTGNKKHCTYGQLHCLPKHFLSLSKGYYKSNTLVPHFNADCHVHSNFVRLSIVSSNKSQSVN